MKEDEAFFARKKQEIGVTLNDVQKKAVLQTEGPLLLLASPGSGKTTTVIMRIGYLIEEMGVDPSRIKAVTFSRASAIDMKERFKRFFPELPPVDFSTIHSLAFEIVREHFRPTNTVFQLIEGNLDVEGQSHVQAGLQPQHKKLILRNLFREIVGEQITDDQMDELTTYISFIKNKMIPVNKWSQVSCDVPEAERIFREYERYKRSEPNSGLGSGKLLVDYDDMLTLGNAALEDNTGLLLRYQQRYDFVLTDESQDTSLVQHAIIEKIVRKRGNLCVVADDDQSIYSWRGAEPSYLLNFKQVFPQAVILFMEQNYRSSKEIVHVANQFIKRNKARYNKNMFTDNPAHKPVSIRNLVYDYEQAKYLVQEIKKVKNLHEVAVLYRNNSSSIPLINEFDRAGIPFYMKDADNRFFSHWVVKDILNFMRMAFTDKRVDIFEKIYTKCNGYITKKQIMELKERDHTESVFDHLLNQDGLQDYQYKQLKECKEMFREMKGMPPLDAIQVIRKKLGYDKAIYRMCEQLGFNKEYLVGILKTLEEIAQKLATLEEFANRLKVLESVMKHAKISRGPNMVTLSTFHSAKGLEFQRVYMIDLIDGIIPSAKDREHAAAGDGASMDEAVRLFYVGMTRAKTDLELITYSERANEEVKESPFVSAVRSLMKIQAEAGVNPAKTSRNTKRTEVSRAAHNPRAIRSLDELEVGKQVKHRSFGQGEILQINEERMQVRFQMGVKNLLTLVCIEMEHLERVESMEQGEYKVID